MHLDMCAYVYAHVCTYEKRMQLYIMYVLPDQAVFEALYGCGLPHQSGRLMQLECRHEPFTCGKKYS